MLDQYADEPLYGTEDNSVDHDRSVLFSVRSDVGQVESLRHLHIQLYSAALPSPSDGILEVEVQLRSVESSVTFVYNKRHAHFLDGVSESIFGHFPFFVGPHGVFRSCGKFHMIFKAEHLIYIVAEFCYILDLIVYLLRQHEDMSIVLSECPYSHQSVESA